MVWASGIYEFASTFSYRIPYFSSSYALTAPAPSPSTIKLAMVASIINRKGNVKDGEALFEKIRTTEVLMELPARMSIFKVFLKRLKKKRQEQAFEQTFGIREYVIYDGPLKIYMNVPETVFSKTLEAMKYVQFFGTSDSTCTCIETKATQPSINKCVRPCSISTKEEMNGMIFLLTDFTDTATFEAVNPFVKKGLRKDIDIVLKPYMFPIKIQKRDKNTAIYSTL